MQFLDCSKGFKKGKSDFSMAGIVKHEDPFFEYIFAIVSSPFQRQ